LPRHPGAAGPAGAPDRVTVCRVLEPALPPRRRRLCWILSLKEAQGPTITQILVQSLCPMASWSIYLAETPAKWLGTIEAVSAEQAVEIAAKKFGEERERLIAVRQT
jgi:hypothetical protein